jgi:hypothetical protein
MATKRTFSLYRIPTHVGGGYVEVNCTERTAQHRAAQCGVPSYRVSLFPRVETELGSK